METRGYGILKDADPTAWGSFKRGSVVISTVNPNVQITAITEGVGEKRIVRQSITKSPFEYYIHGVPPNFPPFDDEKRKTIHLSSQDRRISMHRISANASWRNGGSGSSGPAGHATRG